MQYNFVTVIGTATVSALNTAIWDEIFPSGNQYAVTDYDVEWDEQDSSYWACCAYSDGLPGDAESDNNKRLEFWQWWLNEAVPAAWYAVPEPAGEEGE